MGRSSYDDQHVTEVDQLLPSDDNPSPVRKRRKPGVGTILTVSTFATLAVVYAILSPRVIDKADKHSMRRSKAQKFSPDRQLDKLQHMTDKALKSMTDLPKEYRPSHEGGKRRTKLDKLSGLLGVEDDEDDDVGSSFHCTSQLLIMRHCDKDVNVSVNGKTRTTDNRDIHGNGHCSAKGERRSKYIASLFVDPDEYENLKLNGAGSGRVPAAVPMVSSPLASGNSTDAPDAADAMPQFPAPLRIYALSAERPKRDPTRKFHSNYREIETITPVASKFAIAVDDDYGVNDEGDLARRYFSDLSDRVAGDVDWVLSAGEDVGSRGDDSPLGSQLCNGGLTLVNWKHSQIPVLAKALGCGRDEGCPKRYHGHDFDSMWLLTYRYSLRLPGSSLLDDDENGISSRKLRRQSKLRQQTPYYNGEWFLSAQVVREGFEVE